VKPDDKRWPWIVYSIVLVPVVGQPIVVLGSSFLYFRWRRAWPEAAKRLNRHAWIAVALNIALTLALLRLLRR
jgi:hypothetical protein